jgi:hypothetical protein
MGSPASNLGNLIGGANGAAIDGLGSALGALADIGGTVALVAFVIDALTPSNNSLEVLQESVIQAAQQLGAHQAAEDMNQRLTNIGNALSVATSVLQGLTADLSASLSPADVEARIEKCSQTLDSLSNLVPDAYGGVWYAPYQDQVYWTDYPNNICFYGENDPTQPPPQGASNYCYSAQVPGQDQNAPPGNVYTYILALPAYLQALIIWLTVARALAPTTYLADYGESVLTPAWQFLKAQYDKIVNEGITKLSPIPYIGNAPPGGYMPSGGPVGYAPPGLIPNLTGGTLFYDGPVGSADPIWAPPGSSQSAPAPVAWTGSMLNNWWPNYPDGSGTLTGVAHTTGLADVPTIWNASHVEANAVVYGTVEVFSGFSEIGLYLLSLGVEEGQLDPNSSDLAAYHKFLVRLMKTTQDVYTGAGLLALWKILNSIAAIVGIPLLPRPTLPDWSLREVGNILGLTSLSAILEFMKSTPPDDTAGVGGSLRGVLDVLNPLPLGGQLGLE